MNKEFYQRTKNKINKNTFTNGSYELYKTLVQAYEEYPEMEAVDTDTLRTLHFDKYNPMLTTANRRNMEDLIGIISSQDIPSGSAIEDTLNRIYIREKAKDLANLATDVFLNVLNLFVSNLIYLEESEKNASSLQNEI